jgi:hypothetical protein
LLLQLLITIGVIDIDLGNLGSLIVYRLDSSGISIIKLITSEYPFRVEVSTNGSSENPPPKVVQGYKFNIFYPDLMYVPPSIHPGSYAN